MTQESGSMTPEQQDRAIKGMQEKGEYFKKRKKKKKQYDEMAEDVEGFLEGGGNLSTGRRTRNMLK